jgi:hypothetical protein
LNAGADKEFFGVSEVVDKSNVTLHNISRNNSFLKSWGFIEESENEQGKYKLTKGAAEFASAYRIDPNGNLTRQMLRSLLEKDVILTKLVERIRNENLDRDTILVELPRLIGDFRADKVGLTAFLDMITYAFQTETLSLSSKPTIKPLREIRTTKPTRPTTRPTDKTSAKLIQSSRATLSVNLTISPEISPEKLKEYIKALLEAYDEYGKNA